MKTKNLLLFYTLFFVCSCSKSIVSNINPKQNTASKTVIIEENNFFTDTIYVGDIITNRPLTSQIIEVEGKEKYVLLDQNKLYQFDWKTGVLEDSIDLNKCGSIDNYSGFNYKNKDSIYVYNYNERTLFLANYQGKILNKKEILKEEKKADYEALNKTRIIGSQNYVIMSGGKLGDISDMNDSKRVVSQKVEFSNRTPEDVMSYPNIYNNGFWGGVYMNDVSHTLAEDNNVVYSFPIDHYVRIYNLQTLKKDSIYMGSKYIDAIKSNSDNPIDLFTDKEARIIYYINEHSYGNILYDKYRNLVVRFALHPLGDAYDGDKFNKPLSIITYDFKNKELTESAIFKDYANLNMSNTHVCRDGIAIATFDNKDETKIIFRIFKYSKL